MSSSQATSFTELALSDAVLKAIQAVGYEQPSPIQAASIPHLLNGDDLLGVAQTGTGKTAAFALPLLSLLDVSKKTPQVLVLAPTRELAIQVAEAFQTYASKMKSFHVLPIYGGQDMRGQLRQLTRGPQVIVGTPGRVMDHLRRGSLKLNDLKHLVLDEADEMLRMGFIDDVEWILEHTPKERQIALLSATMPGPIRKVAERYLNNPKEVRIASETKTADHIEQSYIIVNGFDRKLDVVTRILEAQDFDAIIIFVRTKTATAELAEKLEARGYSASALNGDMNQALRERTINRLKKNQLDILVATDVAARGIDVKRVSHVINFDIPYDSEAYVHRIGRTGRAGRSGSAILLVAPREKRLLHAIEKSTSKRIAQMDIPSGKEVSNKRIEQFKELLNTTLNQQSLSFFDKVLEEFSTEYDKSAEEIASALAYLLQKNRPLQVEDAAPVPRPKKNKKRDDRDDNPHSGKKRQRPDDSNMLRYRIEVGRNDNLSPGDVVGAIANEAGVDSQNIGHIKLFDDHSTVDLPKGMPKEVFDILKKVHVRSRPMKISLVGDAEDNRQGNKDKKPKKNKGKKKVGKGSNAAKPSTKPKKKLKLKPKD
jgi:ATP-dependent RNA helicase DeaD